MPSINDFPGSKASKAKANGKTSGKSHTHSAEHGAAEGKRLGKNKRRPGREQSEAPHQAVGNTDVHVVDVETGEYIVNNEQKTEQQSAEKQAAGSHAESAQAQASHQAHAEQAASSAEAAEQASAQQASEKIEIKFTGSEILRAKFPKTFTAAEVIATDWMKDGSFDEIPVEQPLAKYFATKGLRKAKEIEKKVLESPVTEKVAMQALQAGMKAQEIISQVKSKIKK